MEEGNEGLNRAGGERTEKTTEKVTKTAEKRARKAAIKAEKVAFRARKAEVKARQAAERAGTVYKSVDTPPPPPIERPTGKEGDPLYTRTVITDIEEKALAKIRNELTLALGAHAADLVNKLDIDSIKKLAQACGDQTNTVLGEILTEARRTTEATKGVGVTVEEQGKAVVDSIDSQTKKLVAEITNLSTKIVDNAGHLKDAITDGRNEFLKLMKKDSGISPELIQDVENALSRLAYSTDMQNQLMMENTPENLRLPTPERVGRQQERLTDIDRAKLNSQDTKDRLEVLSKLSGDVGEKALELYEEAMNRNNLSDQEKNNATKEIEEDLRRFIDPNKEHGINNEATDTDEAKNRVKNQTKHHSKIYQKVVKDWFEEQMRYMEASELSFEEQRDIYGRVALAVSYFQFRPETQNLGDDIYKDLENRRIHKGYARVFGYTPPSRLMGTAAIYQRNVIQHMFTKKEEDDLHGFIDKDKEKTTTRNAEEFKKFVKLSVDLKERRRQLVQKERNGGALTAEEKSERNGRDIKNYMFHGGKLEAHEAQQLGIGHVFVDDALRVLKDKESQPKGLTSKEKRLKKELEKKLSARRTAGELYNVTFEMAKNDVVVGTAGFFAARVMNFVDRLRNKELYRGTSGIYDSPQYKDKEYSLGMPTYFEGVLKGRFKLKGRGLEDVIDQIDLGSDKIWKDIGIMEENPAHYPADLIDKFEKADEDRSAQWGMDSPLHNPTADGYVQFIKRGGYNQYADTKIAGITDKDSYGDKEASEREIRVAEDLDRRLYWMRTKKAISKLEGLKYFSASEKKKWIDKFAADELISDKQRDYFYRQHLNILGLAYVLDPEKVANFRVDWGTTLGNVRKNKGDITLDAIKEYLKKAFGYIFSD